LVQLLPYPGTVPPFQAPPASHPGPESELLRQELPLDAGVQDEQDPAQYLPVRSGLRPGRRGLRSGWAATAQCAATARRR
jgi:hypothetical protein